MLRLRVLGRNSRVLTRFVSNDAKYFDKILIANRGEISCRVTRTAHDLGIKTVAVYSDPDADSLHVRMADEAVHLGPAQSSQSYLNIEKILKAAKDTGAQAIHPGYGFLSENANFADAVHAAGLTFIGPPASAMRALGDKIRSKVIAKEAGVSIVPGYVGEVENEVDAIRISNEIGFPVMLKASAGGGGKGMRIAWNDQDVREGFRASREEAKASFGDDRMLIEKFVDNPRHIEFQIMADGHGTVLYLNERECSLQRRNQKVIEEAPSIVLDETTRKLMGEQAASLARAVGYQSAGTVEFLVDSKSKNFYFLEMNTRLQVEHPITEYITGFDLVEMMIKVAAGKPLGVKQSDVKINGWAVESRVYAEDPYKGFLPSIGTLKTYKQPTLGEEDEGCLRVDTGVIEGSEISINYDPMISKLITYGKTRSEAIDRQRRALDEYVIQGLNHNVSFLRSCLEHPRFLRGDLTTKFIQEEYPNGFSGQPLTARQLKQLIGSSAIMQFMRSDRDATVSDQLGSFEMLTERNYVVEAAGQRFNVTVAADEDDLFVVGIQGEVQAMAGAHPETKEEPVDTDLSNPLEAYVNWDVDSPLFRAAFDEDQAIVQVLKSTALGFKLQHIGSVFDVKVMTPREAELLPFMKEKVRPDLSKMLLSPMPGAVRRIEVKVGDKVTFGQPLAVVEAMKMQNVLRAQTAGVVKSIKAVAGQIIAADEIILEME